MKQIGVSKSITLRIISHDINHYPQLPLFIQANIKLAKILKSLCLHLFLIVFLSLLLFPTTLSSMLLYFDQTKCCYWSSYKSMKRGKIVLFSIYIVLNKETFTNVISSYLCAVETFCNCVIKVICIFSTTPVHMYETLIIGYS